MDGVRCHLTSGWNSTFSMSATGPCGLTSRFWPGPSPPCSAAPALPDSLSLGHALCALAVQATVVLPTSVSSMQMKGTSSKTASVPLEGGDASVRQARVVAPGVEPELQQMKAEEAQRRELIEWNQTACDCPREKCLHDLVVAQAEQWPERTAVIWKDRKLSYGELNARANQMAHYLRGDRKNTRLNSSHSQ